MNKRRFILFIFRILTIKIKKGINYDNKGIFRNCWADWFGSSD